MTEKRILPGYRLVPVEPTHKMLDEAWAYILAEQGENTWREMINNAPAEAESAIADVIEAARELMADVHKRYPGEELRCPYMRAIETSLSRLDNLK